MAVETFPLLILTPYGRYFEGNVEFLEVHSEDYNLGILPHHAPIISTVAVSKVVIRMGGKELKYAVGGGVLHVTKEGTKLILDSIERADEIDIQRAQQAKERAEKRLKESSKDEEVDLNRAKLALLRALNRLSVSSKD